MSSKFSRSKHAFRSPDVCKKKAEPPEDQNPDPADILESWYDCDIVWFIFHYVFSGTIVLEKLFANHWQTPTPPPTDGEWGTFDWFPIIPAFSAGLQHWVGGVNVATLSITGEPYVAQPDFDTGIFNYTSGLYTGKMQGRIYNP